MKIKIALSLITLILSTSPSFSREMDKDLQQQLESCSKIECSDLQGKGKMECNKSKGLCFRNAFKKRVAIWKELGISASEKKKVLASLEQTQKKNEELHQSIIEEAQYIEKIIDEVKGLQRDLKSLKPTK